MNNCYSTCYTFIRGNLLSTSSCHPDPYRHLYPTVYLEEFLDSLGKFCSLDWRECLEEVGQVGVEAVHGSTSCPSSSPALSFPSLVFPAHPSLFSVTVTRELVVIVQFSGCYICMSAIFIFQFSEEVSRNFLCLSAADPLVYCETGGGCPLSAQQPVQGCVAFHSVPTALVTRFRNVKTMKTLHYFQRVVGERRPTSCSPCPRGGQVAAPG